jgi:hypothetical protein
VCKEAGARDRRKEQVQGAGAGAGARNRLQGSSNKRSCGDAILENYPTAAPSLRCRVLAVKSLWFWLFLEAGRPRVVWCLWTARRVIQRKKRRFLLRRCGLWRPRGYKIRPINIKAKNPCNLINNKIVCIDAVACCLFILYTAPCGPAMPWTSTQCGCSWLATTPHDRPMTPTPTIQGFTGVPPQSEVLRPLRRPHQLGTEIIRSIALQPLTTVSCLHTCAVCCGRSTPVWLQSQRAPKLVGKGDQTPRAAISWSIPASSSPS